MELKLVLGIFRLQMKVFSIFLQKRGKVFGFFPLLEVKLDSFDVNI